MGNGEHSLIWPKWVCAAEQGMIFRILSLKQGKQFHYFASEGLFGPEAFKRI